MGRNFLVVRKAPQSRLSGANCERKNPSASEMKGNIENRISPPLGGLGGFQRDCEAPLMGIWVVFEPSEKCLLGPWKVKLKKKLKKSPEYHSDYMFINKYFKNKYLFFSTMYCIV